MIFSSAKPAVLLLFVILYAPWICAHAEDWQYGGHAKYQFNASQYAEDNIFSIVNNTSALDHFFDIRLKADRKSGHWHYSIHYEALGLYGDTAETLASLPILPSLSTVPTDERRLFSLTQAFGSGNRLIGVHRLDRLVASYTNDSLVARFGRQAISWGNGLMFNPMDLVNPFSPTAISKEYKTGDDMIYAQWLYSSGNDLQGILLPRRDSTGSVDERESSLAVKYHGSLDQAGYDLLLARHYAETVTAVGMSTDAGGAVVRADMVHTRLSDGSDSVSGVVNASYSWVWGKHNVSGNLEYYRNGVGNADGDYNSVFVPTSPLGKRVARGEVFGVGRDYLAGSLTVELSPRLLMSPTWIHNLNDGSGIIQAAFNYDWKQEMPVVFGFSFPYGTSGSEFGGIATGTPGQFYGPGKSVFLQVGYYF